MASTQSLKAKGKLARERAIERSGSNRPGDAAWWPEVELFLNMGFSVKEIAVALNFTERRIRQIKAYGAQVGTSIYLVDEKPRYGEDLDEEFRPMMHFTAEAFELFFNRFSGRQLAPHCREWIKEFCENTNLILNVPPRHAKTTIFGVWLPIWLLAMDRNHEIILVSKTAMFARRQAAEVAYNLKHNTELVKAFGRFAPQDERGDVIWRPSQGDLMVVGRTREAQSGQLSIRAVGIGGQILGMQATCVVVDDATDSNIARSEAQREENLRWLQEEVLTRLMPQGHAVVVGQRVHFMDLYGELASRTFTRDTKRNKRGDQLWTVISHPAVIDWETGETLWPDIWDFDALMETYERIGANSFECLPWSAPVVMADFTDRPVGDIKVGEMVMGFDDKRDHGIQAVPTKVVAVGQRTARVVKITFESGRQIVSTPDHPWFSRGRTANGTDYRPAEVGRRLSLYYPPIEYDLKQQREWWYLAGLIDGEGHIGNGSLRIAQSRKANPGVFSRMIECLDTLGLSYKVEQRTPGEGDDWCVSVHDTKNVLRALMTAVGGEMGKKDQIVKRLAARSTWAQSREKVASIESMGKLTVYNLETETNNYFAYGFPCHNCMYQQNPLPQGSRLVEPEWWERCHDTERGAFMGARIAEDAEGFLPIARVISLDPSPTQFNGLVCADVPYTKNSFQCAIMETKHWQGGMRSIVGELERCIEQYHPDFIIIEHSTYTNWLHEDPLFQALSRRATILGHNTGKNKGDPLLGLESLGGDIEFGRISLPVADEAGRQMTKLLEDEANVWPHGRHDDVLMALWFIKWNYKRLIPRGILPTSFRHQPGRKDTWRHVNEKPRFDPVKWYRKQRVG